MREPAPILAALGRALRARRAGRAWTLEEAARAAGLSVGYLSMVELGRNAISLPRLARLAAALQVRLPDLFAQAETGLSPEETPNP